MSTPDALTPEQATADALAALDAAGFGAPGALKRGGAVRVTSQAVSMPRTFGDAILTTVRASAPLTDIASAAEVLSGLPGVIQTATFMGRTAIYRRLEA